MKLPNAARAIVERQKVVDYLLNASHPGNGGKAQFFASLGFAANEPDRLAEALAEIGRRDDVVKSSKTVFGEKHVVDGEISSQTGIGRAAVRTVWIIDRGAEEPRLVTAYPGRGEGSK